MAEHSIAERLASSEQRIAVTGATGWFGRVTLDLLGQALGPKSFHERVAAYASRARTVEVEGVGEIQAKAFDQLESTDWLLHYAFLTQDRAQELGTETFVTENLKIMRRILDLIEEGELDGLFYTSSGAARQPDIDANPYGALKRLDEIALQTVCQQVATPCVVARVFNVSGPHMTKPELYALGDLILRAQAGRTLEINARQKVVRSFVAVRDVVTLAIALLLDSESAVFETSGEQEVEIEELAERVRATLGVPELQIKRKLEPGAVENRYVGRPEEFARLAARYNLTLTPLEQQIRETTEALS